jgi:hypothetical protein
MLSSPCCDDIAIRTSRMIAFQTFRNIIDLIGSHLTLATVPNEPLFLGWRASLLVTSLEWPSTKVMRDRLQRYIIFVVGFLYRFEFVRMECTQRFEGRIARWIHMWRSHLFDDSSSRSSRLISESAG